METEKITLYARVCKDYEGELDMENMQLYTEPQIRDEAVCIDYVDGDEIDDMSINDLMEVFAKNDEQLIKVIAQIPCAKPNYLL